MDRTKEQTRKIGYFTQSQSIDPCAWGGHTTHGFRRATVISTFLTRPPLFDNSDMPFTATTGKPERDNYTTRTNMGAELRSLADSVSLNMGNENSELPGRVSFYFI